MYKYVNVPVELCFFAFRHHFVRPLQLFVYLKATCDGFHELDIARQEQIARELGLKTSRALRYNLSALRQRDWIGYDKHSKRYIIRGYNRVMLQEQCSSRTRADFNIRDIKQFKAFAAGAVMCYLINQQRKNRWLEAREKGRALPSGHLYYPVSVVALSKILNVSQRTAHMIRHIAVKHNHVLLKHNWIKTGVNANELSLYRKALPEIAGKLTIQQNSILERKPDLYASCMRLSRGKKVKHI